MTPFISLHAKSEDYIVRMDGYGNKKMRFIKTAQTLEFSTLTLISQSSYPDMS